MNMGNNYLLYPKTYCTDIEHDCSLQEHLGEKLDWHLKNMTAKIRV